MVAPAPGSGNESVSYTINIDVRRAKESLENIARSEDDILVKIQRLKELILEWSNTTGKSVSQVTNAFKMLGGEINNMRDALNEASKQAKIESVLSPNSIQNADGAASGFTTTLSKLGSVGQFVFGTVLGITAVGALRNIKNFFVEATDAAIKFNQTQFQFEAGVRAVQRTGLDVTLQEYKDSIDELQKKYPIFSRQDLLEGYSNILLLARGLGFTREQLEQIAEVSITASAILGRDFGETATGITKSLSSGWFEAAQRAGFLISRQRVVDEGLKLNIENAKSGYNAMTEYERALAALTTYVRENKTLQEDTTRIMETQAGKVLTAQAAWENFQVSVGRTIAPFKAIGAERFTGLLTVLDHMAVGALRIVTILIAFQQTLDEVQERLLQFIRQIPIIGDVRPIEMLINGFKIFKGLITDIIELVASALAGFAKWELRLLGLSDNVSDGLRGIDSAIKSIIDNLNKTTKKGETREAFSLESIWKRAVQDAARFTGLSDLMGDIGKDAAKYLIEGFDEGMEADRIAEAFQDLMYDIEDEYTRLTNRIAQLQTDLNRKLADLAADYQRDVRRAEADYLNDVEETNISSNIRRAEAERKYRIGEINAEARFQEELRQLRTQFLFDLEDALRERDAGQVLRLTRQYQMEKTNVIKEAELAREERRRAFEEELRDIEIQRAEKLRILAEEYELARQRRFEDWQQAQADAKARFEQEKADEENRSEERIKQQILDFQREYGLTVTQAQKLVQMLERYFGTSGPLAQIYRNVSAYIMSYIALWRAAIMALGGIPGLAGFGNTPSAPSTPNTPSTGNGNRYAKGGTLLATRPTTAIFGEAGPEFATFTPLSQIGQHQQNMNQAFSSVDRSSPSIGGKLQLMLGLDPDLRVEIMNDTLYEVTTTIEEVNRGRR